MRCSGCNKFAAVGEIQAMADSYVEIADETLYVDVTVSLLSECCGVEIATNTFNVEIGIGRCCDNPDWGTTEDDVTDSEDTATCEVKIRKGSRKGETRTESTPLYGFDFTAMIHCSNCGADFQVEHSDHEPAGTFEVVY